jgi:hypothetical protein
MNKGLIFLCLSCGLLFLTIITICVAPIITGVLGGDWGVNNCQEYADAHKKVEDNKVLTNDEKDKILKYLDKGKHLCERRKAMYGLEYAALISDIVFGFSCTLLSLLHFFGVGKNFEKITGLIGLISGIIGFILTFIYIIYSGYIFTNDNDYLSYQTDPDNLDPDDLDPYESHSTPKLDKNREFAKWNEEKNKYECLFYDKDDYDSLYPKYNDLGKKQYNYHKDFSFPDDNSKYSSCQLNDFYSSLPQPAAPNPPINYSEKSKKELCNILLTSTYTKLNNDCTYLFYEGNNDISNKYQYDKWVTSIIFGCIIILLDLGLAVFGFLMFKDSDSSGLVSLK